MTQYWIIFCYILFTFWFSRYYKSNLNILFFIAIGIEILLGGLRDISVGTDTENYISILESIISNGKVNIDDSEFASRDSFFWYLYGTILLICQNYSGLFLLHSALNWILFAFSIKNISKNIYVAFLVYITFRFSDLHLSAMRQGISLVILLYAFKYIVNRKLPNYILLVLFAMLFHKSAIIALPLFWLYSLKIENIKKIHIAVLCIIFFLLKNTLYNYIFSYLLQNETYELYLKIEMSHGILYYTLYVISFTFCLLFYDKKDRISNGLLIFVLLGVCLQSITLVNPIFNRLSVFYTVFFTLLIPRVYCYNCLKYNKSIPTVIISFFFILLYIIGGPAPGVVPYKFYWD